MSTLRRVRLPRILLAAGWFALAPIGSSAETATLVYGYVVTPPPAAASPRILRVELNSDHLRAGGPIDLRVSTSPDVVSVCVGSGKNAGQLPRMGRGVFASESTLPHIGFFFFSI